jgi:hypothetical protein
MIPRTRKFRRIRESNHRAKMSWGYFWGLGYIVTFYFFKGLNALWEFCESAPGTIPCLAP